jgi:hypothetical protein
MEVDGSSKTFAPSYVSGSITALFTRSEYLISHETDKKHPACFDMSVRHVKYVQMFNLEPQGFFFLREASLSGHSAYTQK